MYNLPVDQHPTERWATIVEGARTQRVIALRYRDKSFEVSERLVEPYEIKQGKLFAHCLTKNGMRAFILDNILAAAGTNTEFVPRFPVVVESFQSLKAKQ
jgi:predicted DNA-binding transcriptional regulator YafY